MHILMLCKYPPIQGGVSADTYWLAQIFASLGHKVTIVTNAREVEAEYRLEMSPEDEALLVGYWNPGSIRVIETTSDVQHSYIPQANPFTEKLLGVALQVVESDKPDFIFSYYVQPYGVAAMHLSMLTGIPYAVRHAGSDLGRLMLTTQLEPLYKEVFRRARFVLTREQHHDFFRSIGVSEKSILQSLSYRLPGDVFYTVDEPIGQKGRFTYYVFGKVGKSKGTYELINALLVLQQKNSLVRVVTNWGGVHLPHFMKMIREKGISAEYLTVDPFVPHWRMGDRIRSSDAVLFLENRFGITFHGPGIPAEANACGRHLVTTREIRDKRHVQSFLSDENTSVVSLEELNDPERFAQKLEDLASHVRKAGHPKPVTCLDASLQSMRSAKFIQEQLDFMQQRL